MQFTLERDKTNENRGYAKHYKFMGYIILFGIVIIWGCLTTYLISEIIHLKEHVKHMDNTLSEKISTETKHLKKLVEDTENRAKDKAQSILNSVNTRILRLSSTSNDASVTNGQLRILINMQNSKISTIDGKLGKIKEDINMNILRNNHMEKALGKLVLQEPINYEALSNDNENKISNVTFTVFENYIISMLNASQKLSTDALSTLKTLMKDHIDELNVEIKDLKQDQDRISSLFDGWKTSDDEGKLYVDLKETVDILKFSSTSKNKQWDSF
jgi:methyl-accepting chemotaxis protein